MSSRKRVKSEQPPNTTLDRINNSLGYFKDNCRWADWITQANNKRKSFRVRRHAFLGSSTLSANAEIVRGRAQPSA